MARGRFSFLDEAMNESSKAKNTDKMIDIDLIDPYEFNDEIYPPEQYEEYMEELIEDIRRRGLQQPIELMVNPEDPLRYISIGGNRRCQAIRHLVNDERLDEFRMVKATISDMTEEEAKINCIMSNSYRDKTNYTMLKEIEILQQVANDKKARGEEIGVLRVWLANRSGLKETQTGKVQRVINKGTEDVKEALKEDVLTLEAASEIASLQPEKQKEIIKMVDNGEMSNTDAIEVAKEIKKEEKKASPGSAVKQPKQINVEKTWNKITSDLNKLRIADEEEKDLIDKILNLIEEARNGR